MPVNLAKKNITDKLGWFLFIGSLVFYFLIKLPFNLSVLCSSTNEGFYFIYGMNFLNWIPPKANLFFIILYSIILKFFGFGAKSIIIVHWIQTLFVLLNGILIFLIVNKILSSRFFAGLAIFFWVFIITTPIGGWGKHLELESAYSLEAESICVFLSLLSIYLLMISTPINPKIGIKEKLLPFIAGILSMSSIMFKANGAIISISILCWFFYLLLFEREKLKLLKSTFSYCLAGFILSFLIFNLIICFLNHNLFSYWNYQYSVGSYSGECFISTKEFLLFLIKIMMRDSGSFSNFILFFFTFLFIIWGLLREILLKNELNKYSLFVPLLAIWGVGNFCAVIAPGAYGSYYYILVWPTVAIFIIIGIRDLFNYMKLLNHKIFKTFFLILVLMYFVLRIYTVLPGYIFVVKRELRANLFFQPESFQDAVKLKPGQFKTDNSYRSPVLSAADFINNLLPDKNDTFYVLNFADGHQDFSPTFYIYVKRLPPTSIFSDFLHYKNFLKERERTLIKDLKQKPPKLFILPALLKAQKWQEKRLMPFFDWFRNYVNKNYHFKTSFYYAHSPYEKTELYHIFERNK